MGGLKKNKIKPEKKAVKIGASDTGEREER